MFEPVSRRGWGSLYQAVQHGRVDVAAARRLLAAQVRQPEHGRLMFAIDSSKYPRLDTRYVPDVSAWRYTPKISPMAPASTKPRRQLSIPTTRRDAHDSVESHVIG